MQARIDSMSGGYPVLRTSRSPSPVIEGKLLDKIEASLTNNRDQDKLDSLREMFSRDRAALEGALVAAQGAVQEASAAQRKAIEELRQEKHRSKQLERQLQQQTTNPGQAGRREEQQLSAQLQVLMVGIGLLKLSNLIAQRASGLRGSMFQHWAAQAGPPNPGWGQSPGRSAAGNTVREGRAQAQLEDLQQEHAVAMQQAAHREQLLAKALEKQQHQAAESQAKLRHMTRMFAGLMLGGDLELRSARRAGLWRLVRAWRLQSELAAERLRVELSVGEVTRRHQAALRELREEASQSIELKDLEREQQLKSLARSQRSQNRELLLVFGVHTLSSMIESAVFRTVQSLFEHWKSFVTMIRYTARLNEVLRVERGALLAAGAHAQDELSDARAEAERLKARLAEQEAQLSAALVKAASHEADVSYRKQLQTRVLMLEDSLAGAESAGTSVFCRGRLRMLATNNKMFGWVQRWVQLDSDALLFWEEEPEAESVPPSSVITLGQICAVAASTKQRFSFRVSVSTGDPIFLEADSEQARADWMAAIATCRQLLAESAREAPAVPRLTDQEQLLELGQTVAVRDAQLAQQRIVFERAMNELCFKCDQLIARSAQFDEDLWRWVEQLLQSKLPVLTAPQQGQPREQLLTTRIDVAEMMELAQHSRIELAQGAPEPREVQQGQSSAAVTFENCDIDF